MTKSGSCLCGAVRYSSPGPWRPSIACHCGQCRKSSGHYWSATQVPTGSLTIDGGENVTWFRSSDTARRGFCRHCGSTLFWRPDDAAVTSIGTGTLDGATGLATQTHIYVEDKGDYYAIPEGEGS